MYFCNFSFVSHMASTSPTHWYQIGRLNHIFWKIWRRIKLLSIWSIITSFATLVIFVILTTKNRIKAWRQNLSCQLFLFCSIQISRRYYLKTDVFFREIINLIFTCSLRMSKKEIFYIGKTSGKYQFYENILCLFVCYNRGP